MPADLACLAVGSEIGACAPAHARAAAGVRAPAPRVLVVGARPDDETIGASALLGCRDPVWGEHVTDGVPADSRWWPRGFRDRDAYRSARDREAQRAPSIVGVERVALGFIDQEVVFALRAVIAALAELVRRIRPDVIVTHAYEGGHPDHDAVALAVVRAPVTWPPPVPRCSRWRRITVPRRRRAPAPCSASRRARRTLSMRASVAAGARCSAPHRSQATVLASFVAAAHEVFRPAPRYDFSRAPHAGTLFYERLAMSPGGDEWRALVQRSGLEVAHERTSRWHAGCCPSGWRLMT